MKQKYLNKQCKNCHYKSKKILILFFFFVFNLIIAQNFTNGDFEANIGASTAPTGWTLVSGSSDVGNVSDPGGSFAQPFTNSTPSAQGGNFLMLYENGSSSTESVEQSVSGFTIGNSYTITYQEAVLGARNNYDDNGELIINVSGIGDFTSGNILTVGAGWQSGQISFVATQTTHTIRLTANDIGAGGPGSWMSLDDFQLTDTTLSIEDITLDKKIAIYPNPVTDIVTISFEKDVMNDIKVSIYNISGQKVYSSTPNIVDNKASFDLSNISSGFYLLKVNTKDGFITKEIIIE